MTFNTGNGILLDNIQYQDSNGVTQTIHFTWQSFILDVPWADSTENTDPNCPNPATPPWTCYTVNSQSMSLLTDIALPNNLHYSFEYETNPGGSTTGQIKKIILPTGGYIRYGEPSACLPKRRRFSRARTLGIGSLSHRQRGWNRGLGSDMELRHRTIGPNL